MLIMKMNNQTQTDASPSTEKKCKKCQKILPAEYKYKLCENCRNERVYGLKEMGKKIAGGATVMGGIIFAVVIKGKVNPNDKS